MWLSVLKRLVEKGPIQLGGLRSFGDSLFPLQNSWDAWVNVCQNRLSYKPIRSYHVAAQCLAVYCIPG